MVTTQFKDFLVITLPNQNQIANQNGNDLSKKYKTIDLGPTVKIYQINIESLSRVKYQYLERILKENETDIVAVQETLTKNNLQEKSPAMTW